MNAFNTVDLTAACLVTSTDHARNLGIDESHWVYIRGGAGTSMSSDCKVFDPDNKATDLDTLVLRRPNFFSSASLTKSIDHCLQTSGLDKEEIDVYDIYSCVRRLHFLTHVANLSSRCFPIVPKLAAAHLGLPITGQENRLTVLGGLTSFGGAGNNYSLHV